MEVAEGGLVEAVSVGVIDVSAHTGDGARCVALQAALGRLMTPTPAQVCMELYFGHGHAADVISLKLRGAIDMLTEARQLPLSVVAPNAWKAHAAANGSASKAEIKRALEARLGSAFPRQLHIGARWAAFRSDASDALGIALYAARARTTGFAPRLAIETPDATVLVASVDPDPGLSPAPPAPRPAPAPCPAPTPSAAPAASAPSPAPAPPLPALAVAVGAATAHGEGDVLQAAEAVARAVAAAAVAAAPGAVGAMAEKLGDAAAAAAEAHEAGDATLAARVMKRGLEAAAALAHSRDAGGERPEKRSRQIDLAMHGQCTIRPVSEHANSFAQLWRYWRDTIWPREARGPEWRTKTQLVNREYNSQQFFVREVARWWDLGEEEALRRAQDRLQAAGSWTKLKKTLEAEQPAGPVRSQLNAALARALT